MADLFANFAYCQLTADVTSGATTFSVDELGRLPSSATLGTGEFWMTIESSLAANIFEIVQVTAKSASSGAGTLTVVRAQDGTTGSAHVSGTILKSAVTAGMLGRLQLPGIMAAPTTTTSNGTPSSGTTETRDAVLGNYSFTAVAGRRYRAMCTNRAMNTDTANDRYAFRIRNGGASTPTAASTAVAEAQHVVTITAGSGRLSVPVIGTFVPGAGTVTLGMFTVRIAGSGICTPVTQSVATELYAEDIGGV